MGAGTCSVYQVAFLDSRFWTVVLFWTMPIPWYIKFVASGLFASPAAAALLLPPVSVFVSSTWLVAAAASGFAG